MHICPHCNKPGVGKVRKIFLGPGKPAVCKSCGGKVINDFVKAHIAVIPLYLSTASLFLLDDRIVSYTAIAISLPVSYALTTYWVPFVKK